MYKYLLSFLLMFSQLPAEIVLGSFNQTHYKNYRLQRGIIDSIIILDNGSAWSVEGDANSVIVGDVLTPGTRRITQGSFDYFHNQRTNHQIPKKSYVSDHRPTTVTHVSGNLMVNSENEWMLVTSLELMPHFPEGEIIYQLPMGYIYHPNDNVVSGYHLIKPNLTANDEGIYAIVDIQKVDNETLITLNNNTQWILDSQSNFTAEPGDLVLFEGLQIGIIALVNLENKQYGEVTYKRSKTHQKVIMKGYNSQINPPYTNLILQLKNFTFS